jgi:hypothetical protein
VRFCSHAVEDDDVTHALSCNRLSAVVLSRHRDTTEVLREFVGRLGFSFSREGQYLRLATRTLNPREFHRTLGVPLHPAPRPQACAR